jgi:hypothetical protein
MSDNDKGLIQFGATIFPNILEADEKLLMAYTLCEKHLKQLVKIFQIPAFQLYFLQLQCEIQLENVIKFLTLRSI